MGRRGVPAHLFNHVQSEIIQEEMDPTPNLNPGQGVTDPHPEKTLGWKMKGKSDLKVVQQQQQSLFYDLSASPQVKRCFSYQIFLRVSPRHGV